MGLEPTDRNTEPSSGEHADLYRVLRIAGSALLVAGAMLAVAWIIWIARVALSPFLLGMVIAYVLLPFVNRIEGLMPDRGILHHVRRTIAVLTVYIMAFAMLTSAFIMIGPNIIGEVNELVENAPEYWDEIRQEGDYWVQRYESDVPSEIRVQIESNVDQLGSTITSTIRSGIVATIGTVRRFLGILLGLLILPLWVFYVLKDHHRGAHVFYRVWPAPIQPDVRNVVGIVDHVLGRYIRGQLFLGLVVGLVSGIGFWVIGVQQPLALGVIAGVLEMVPILGPWISFFVAALVVLATDPSKIVPVAILCFMVQQLENTFLVPRVQGTAVSMNPAVIMVLLVIGGSIGGIFGVIAVVPIAAVSRDVFLYVHGRLSGGITLEPPSLIDEQTAQPPVVSPQALIPEPRILDQ
jgi:predicted PurR-regulated permease PerM